MNGYIVRMVPDKGYGFIRGEDKHDYFFHSQEFNGFFNDLVEDFGKGLKIHVTFNSVPSSRGLRAGQVSRMDGGIVLGY